MSPEATQIAAAIFLASLAATFTWLLGRNVRTLAASAIPQTRSSASGLRKLFVAGGVIVVPLLVGVAFSIAGVQNRNVAIVLLVIAAGYALVGVSLWGHWGHFNRTTVISALCAAAIMAGLWCSVTLVRSSSPPHSKPVRAPAPPGMLTITSSTVASPFLDTERPISPSAFLPMAGPCVLKRAPRKAPIGGKPFLVVDPRRMLFRVRIQEPDVVDILVEATVTNRGASSIAKHWELCWVADGKAQHYRTEDIASQDVASFEDKVSLEQASGTTPIEQGHGVTGWLLFQVDKNAVKFDAIYGALECKDYQDYRYSFLFGPTAGSKSGGGGHVKAPPKPHSTTSKLTSQTRAQSLPN